MSEIDDSAKEGIENLVKLATKLGPPYVFWAACVALLYGALISIAVAISSSREQDE
jgi:hypothetical protein